MIRCAVPHRRRIVVAVCLILAGTSFGACGAPTSEDRSAPPATSTATASTGSTNEATEPDRVDEAAADGATDDLTLVRSRAFAIEDPDLGPLTFDGLVAGDPAAVADGRLVVLLHGFPESAEAYRDILDDLAGAGYYAVAYSQRGYSPGARPEAVEQYQIFAMVRDLFAVADSLQASSFHVVGHDWGGAVAWLAAVAHPERITSLTALSTPHPDAMNAGIADPADPQHAASAYMAVLREPGSEDAFLTEGASTFRQAFGPSGGGLPADAVDVYASLLATPDALRAALNWYRANPLPPPISLGPVRVPTLYLWGAEDGAFARVSAERTAGFVEGPYTFVELEDQGHWLPERAPGPVVDHLLTHLRATTGS